MTRIYISEFGNDKNDGLTKQTPIYSWKRARKISGHIEITVDQRGDSGKASEDIQGE